MLGGAVIKGKGKDTHTRVEHGHEPGGGLPLLSARLTITFLAVRHHRL